MKLLPKLAVPLLLFSYTFALSQAAPPQFSLDAEALATEIVERLDLQPGERFIAVAHPGLFDDVIQQLRYEVAKAGAIDLGVLDVLEEPVPAGWDGETLSASGSAARDVLRDMLRDVDASVMLPGANPTHPAYAAIQDLLKVGKGRTIHFHWLQGGGNIALPGQPLPATHVIAATYQAAILDTDYRALAEQQRGFEAAMRGADIRVTNAAGTDLSFRIGDRPVNRQDGDASAERTGRGRILIDRAIELPAGVVRVAPIESTVNGRIVFPPSQWAGRPVTGLELTFERGRIVDVSADSGVDAALEEIDGNGEAGRAFRELGLGFNPLLAVPDQRPWIPYFGYGAGVVRLSLGDNTELGGDVGGGYSRWNFFTDMTVTVDGEVWVEEGRLVK
ncbi:MAG: aminopeptidase [Pseudomonadota bacterium]